MMRSQQGIPYAKDLTPKNRLTKDNLDHLADLERQALEASRSKTAASRKNLQMSIRMEQEDYLRFRAVCRALRKTNGDMLTELLANYLDQVSTGSFSKAKQASSLKKS